MNKTTLFALVGAGVLAAVAVWFAIGDFERSGAISKELAEALAQKQVADEEMRALAESTTSSIAELSRSNRRLQAERDALAEHEQQLQVRVQELSEQLEAFLVTAESVAAEPTPAGGLPVSFAEWGELAELLDADWEGMAGAVTKMNDMIEDLHAMILAGEEPSREAQLAIAKENQRLSQYALEVIGKLPTTNSGNGEYSHPITLSNLTAAVLDQAGQPLTDAQRAAVADLGERYEEEWERVQTGYSDDTLGLTQFIDELALKQDFASGMRGQMTAAQLAASTPESIAGRTRLDVLSPVVMTTGLGNVIKGSDRDSVKAEYINALSRGYGIEADRLNGLDYVFDSWLSTVQPILTPRSADGSDFYDLDTAVLAGRAHARVLQDILASSDLDEATREKLLTGKSFAVPVLIGE